MKLEPKPSPRHPEIMVYRNGRMYDTVQDKWINTVYSHPIPSIKGPVAYWTTMGKLYNLDVLKMVYETYISTEVLMNHWTLEFKNGTEVMPENIRKTKRHHKNDIIVRPVVQHDSWMNGDSDIYLW